MDNENKLAAESTLTQEEIQIIFQGERRDVMYRTRDRIWSEHLRAEYRKHGGMYEIP